MELARGKLLNEPYDERDRDMKGEVPKNGILNLKEDFGIKIKSIGFQIKRRNDDKN